MKLLKDISHRTDINLCCTVGCNSCLLNYSTVTCTDHEDCTCSGLLIKALLYVTLVCQVWQLPHYTVPRGNLHVWERDLSSQLMWNWPTAISLILPQVRFMTEQGLESRSCEKKATYYPLLYIHSEQSEWDDDWVWKEELFSPVCILLDSELPLYPRVSYDNCFARTSMFFSRVIQNHNNILPAYFSLIVSSIDQKQWS